MIPVFGARRRAEEFDTLVEHASTGARVDARDAEFLQIVASLRALPPVQARPEFVADLREQLMTAADTVLVPREDSRLALPARKRARDRRLSVAVGGLALVGATTSVAMAAQSALPGDALYPIKRALENAETGLAVDEGAKGSTLLENAIGRLQEVSELTREGSLEDRAAIAETLDTFTEQSTEASDLLLADYAATGSERSISDLRDFTADSMRTLADLEAVVPADARDELLHAARVLTQIDAAAARACPSCGGLGITEIPAILTSAGFGSEPAPAVEPAAELQPVQEPRKKADGKAPPAPQLPTTEGPQLPPGSVLGQAPADDEPEQTDGGSPDAGTSNPIEDLTEDLTGRDGSGSTSHDAELVEVDELEDVVKDLTDPLTDPLTGVAP